MGLCFICSSTVKKLRLIFALLLATAVVAAPVNFGVWHKQSSGPFDPSQLTSLILWLEADQQVFQDSSGLIPCVADGNSVGAWKDLSGAGVNLTSGSTPTWKTNLANGKPGVRFSSSGTTAMNSSQSNNQKPFSVGVVVRMTNAANNNTILDGSTGSGGLAIDVNANAFRMLKASVALIGASTATVSNNTFYIAIGTCDGSGNWTWTTNGAADGSGTNNQTLSDTQTQMGKANAGSAFFDGDILAIAKGSAAWSSTEVSKLDAYWNAKYTIH